MARVRAGDLGRLLRVLAGAAGGDAAAPIPRHALVALRDLLGASDAEYFELRRTDRAVIAHVQSDTVDEARGSDEALRRYGAQNPLNWRRWRPRDGAMRLSQRVHRRTLERLEFHDGFLRANGLTDNLKVWLHSDEDSAACVQLWRRGGTFAQRDEDLLGIAQAELSRLRADAVRSAPVAAAAPTLPSLTRREAEILSWAARGATDAEIAARLGVSPATVGKHLENAFAALGVHSRTEALWRLTGAAGAEGVGSNR
jgi:DNA-binding CsgD family transcriptional regulator